MTYVSPTREKKRRLVQHLKDEQIPCSVGMGGEALLIVRTSKEEDVERIPKEWEGVHVVARAFSR